MAKRKVTCPECGHTHTIIIDSLQLKTMGVRAKRGYGKQVNYEVTFPEGAVEADRLTTIFDDLVGSLAVGVAAGSTIGFLVSPIVPVDYTLYFIGASASAGTLIAWSCLCSEGKWRKKITLPRFLRERHNWPLAGGIPVNGGEVRLRIDHSHRDNLTEAGRTIQYFGILPVDVERFNNWAQDALRGDSLAISRWTGTGAPFSRREYEALLAKFRAAGLITLQAGSTGNTLTGGGRRALIRHLRQEGIKPAA